MSSSNKKLFVDILSQSVILDLYKMYIEFHFS